MCFPLPVVDCIFGDAGTSLLIGHIYMNYFIELPTFNSQLIVEWINLILKLMFIKALLILGGVCMCCQ